MNVEKIQCLVDQGVLTQEQANQIIQYSQLPQGVSELLTIIASSLLQSTEIAPPFGTALGTETVSASSSQNISLTPVGGATKAVVTPHQNSVIFRTDGGAVNEGTFTGHFLAQGSNFIVEDLASFRFKSASSSVNVTLYVTYY